MCPSLLVDSSFTEKVDDADAHILMDAARVTGGTAASWGVVKVAGVAAPIRRAR